METDADSKDEWSRARALFLDFADLEGEQRERELAQLEEEDPRMGAWVRRLLEHDSEPATEVLDVRASEVLEHFGPYKAVRRIGAGGMGEVYLAQRIDGEFEREVAVKRLHAGAQGEQLVERFLRERQTLARLDHEYIARLIDGGTTEAGEPYLVLEYVEGRHIDTYCREEALGVRERIELFIKVLKAVQYAHDRGVIHRDLKPGNILVRADGQPRLLDFGIARATGGDHEELARLTGTGQRLFTPEYASPEQVRGDSVDESTDVFSLGVILYQLLCDAGPWEGSGSMHELERRILDQDPLPPSRRRSGTARRALTGDLDTIVLGCLAKSPSARLTSPATLADELDRYLHGLPIRTRATGLFGRILRHSRRNPWQSLAAVTLVSALLIGAQARRSEKLAQERHAELATSLAGRIVQARNLRTQDQTEKAREELDSILESLKMLPDQTEIELRALVELSMVLLRQRREQEALPLISRAFGLRPEDPSQWVTAQARLLIVATSCYRVTSAAEQASKAAEEAYSYTRQWLNPGHDLRLEAFTEYAGQAGSNLSLDERIAVLDEALNEAKGRDDPRGRNIGSIQILRGRMLMRSKKYESALQSYDEALEIVRWHHGEGHGDVALVRDARGTTLRKLKRYDEAMAEFEAAIEVFEELGHEEKVAKTLKHIGELEWSMGDHEAALEDLGLSLESLADQLGIDSPDCRELSSLMGLVQLDIQEWADAADSFKTSLESTEGGVVLAADFEAEARFGYARALMMLGELERACQEAEATIAIRVRDHGPRDRMATAAGSLLTRARSALEKKASKSKQ